MNSAMIGRFFAEEWQRANNNEGEFYTPPLTSSMTLDELNAIKTKLQDLVTFWTYQTNPWVNTNQTAVLNAQAIADLEQSKLDAVNAAIAALTQQQPGGGTTTAGNNNSLMWIMAVGAGILILFGGKLFGKKKHA